MAIDFGLEKLTSRKVRDDVGIRILGNMDKATVGKKPNGVVGFLGSIWDGLMNIGGWLIQDLGDMLSITWSSFWGWIVSTTQFIWNFDWNQTDAQIDKQILDKWASVTFRMGGLLGRSVGWLACGVTPALIIASFNEPMGAYVLSRVTEEATEDLLADLASVLKAAFYAATEHSFMWNYQNARKIIKSNSKLIKKLFGKKAEAAVKAWGTEGSKPWSFAIATDKALDNIFGKDTPQRKFADEFIEEALDACVEAGYVVANSVDTWLAQNALNNDINPSLGRQRYVEITPNRDIPEEKIVIGGREEIIKQTITQTLVDYNQLKGKDLGVVYGVPASEFPERRHRPEVVLKFYRPQNKLKSKGDITTKLSMEISFRLMDKTYKDFADDKYLKQLAQKIYRKFAKPPFTITKKADSYSYSDFEKGYQFRLLTDANEARRVIKAVLDLQGHTFNNDLLRKGSQKADTTTGVNVPDKDKVTIRGNIITIDNTPKVGKVTFTHAYINPGLKLEPINLVDLTRKKTNVVFNPLGTASN